MAEMVIRARRKPHNRWMHGDRLGLKRLTEAQVRALGRFLLELSPGMLLSFTDVLGIPSALWGAYVLALASCGRNVVPPLCGSGAAILLRVIWGIAPRWETLLPIALLLLSPAAAPSRSTALLMGMAALTALPTALVWWQGTAAEMLLGLASVPVAALSAPLMYRGVRALNGGRHIESMEERISVGYLAVMILCGGCRMLILGVNVGVLLASLAVLCMAVYLGTGAGCASGMVAGVMLAMQGLPLEMAVALSLGGFMAGIAHGLGRRRITCLSFAMCSLLAMLISDAAGLGCGMAAVLAAFGFSLLPRRGYERAQLFFRRFLTNQAAPGDAYAACALSAWEKTVEAMALAVPTPADLQAARDGAWWEQKLCEGCPDRENCGCMRSELAVHRAESVYACRGNTDEIWQDALESLRGLGCARLYQLRQNMTCLREETILQEQSARRAADQRDMLVTHLTAMAGAARRFAMLSAGESWWDEMSARRIRKKLAELAMPMRLSYVRRVQGHVSAAFELQYITGARKQAEDLRILTSSVLDAPMQVMRIDVDRVQLAERPLMRVETGLVSACIDGGNDCGDTVWHGDLQDGRFMVALSDGMGHGEQAAMESRQTTELLRLCLEAGYTRAQTLTAVNGMMLLAGRGERFSTVDLLTIDLWSGQAALDKLGAAGSWLAQRDTLLHLTGDALPLGILENVESRARYLKLSAGDTLVLMTDGVEDAFASPADMESAVAEALQQRPQQAAQQLLEAAWAAADGERRDDQTVLVVRVLPALEQEEDAEG